MKRKLLSMLMALVMVIGLLPTAAFAVEITTIDSVAITVDAPVAGRTPDYSIGLPENANYEVLTAYELDNGIVDGTFWQTTSGGSSGSGTILTSDTAFTADTEYEVTVYLVANEGYEFSESAIGMVNDTSSGVSIVHDIHSTVQALASGRDIITISYTFTAAAPTTHEITAGGESEFNKQGSADELSITADAGFDKFEGVEVDGSEIDESNYIAESGSTIVKLKKEYLNTLSAGQHSLKMLFSDGSASTNFTITDKEIVLKEVTVPVSKYVFAGGNVIPGAKDFTVAMKLVDNDGVDVSGDMGFVVTDNKISTDGEHLYNNPTIESISFAVPEDKYDELANCKLEVKEVGISEKGWVTDASTITVGFVKGETEGNYTFNCDGGILNDLPAVVLYNNYTIYDIEIPVKKIVEVVGEGAAPERIFEFEVYAVNELSRDNFGNINGTIGSKFTAVTGNTVETAGADDYTTTVKVSLDGTEFTENGATLLITEKDESDDEWTYMTAGGPKGWMIHITPIIIASEDEPFTLPSYQIAYYMATINDSTVSTFGSPITEPANQVAFFENTYTVPVPVVVTIPFTKTVKAIGNGTVPPETFQFDVEFPYAPENFELGEGDIVASIETNGAGTYDGEITITMTDREFDSACTQNGSFAVLISEKNEGADRWAYFPFDYWVEFSGWVIASEEESDAPQASISKYPNATAACYMMSGIGDNAVPDRERPFDMPVFENSYTVPVNYIIEIPFTKEVKLGGNRSEALDFEFELLVPNYQDELDMKVEGTTVETNGKGTYEGELTITVAEEHLQYLAEGMVLVEKNTGASNWTYEPFPKK